MKKVIISENKIVQSLIYNLKNSNIKDIIICPGSRNAPLIISFTNDTYFNCYSIVDERSAGFFAIGLMQGVINKKVAIISTSGSAALNFSPSISEAFYQNLPLLIITADRPISAKYNGEGQYINQINVYKNYIKNSYNIDFNDIDNIDIYIQNAIYDLSNEYFGPVHINIPFEEPLYNIIKNNKIPIINNNNCNKVDINSSINHNIFEKQNDIWKSANKILIIIGIYDKRIDIDFFINNICVNDKRVYVFSENISNLSSNINTCIDRTISNNIVNDNIYIPDLVITIGHSIISKKIKTYLRKSKINNGITCFNYRSENIFETVNHHIINNIEFLNKLIPNNSTSDYNNIWNIIYVKSKDIHNEYLKNCNYSDLQVYDQLVQLFEKIEINIQMGNSSVVRYFQLFESQFNKKYFANRGVSGIEGNTSTALGFAQNNKTIFITGDISFMYDSNAFWNKYTNQFLKIIVINNGGGNIFKFLDGPSLFTKSLDYFVCNYTPEISKIANLYNIEYFYSSSIIDINKQFSNFVNSKSISIMEIDTQNIENEQILKEYFKKLNNDIQLEYN